MPIFEYQCECKAEFEKLVFHTDDQDIHCPECNSTLVIKKMSATNGVGSNQCGPGSPSGGASPFS